jgi:hypothetical protein
MNPISRIMQALDDDVDRGDASPVVGRFVMPSVALYPLTLSPIEPSIVLHGGLITSGAFIRFRLGPTSLPPYPWREVSKSPRPAGY